MPHTSQQQRTAASPAHRLFASRHDCFAVLPIWSNQKGFLCAHCAFAFEWHGWWVCVWGTTPPAVHSACLWQLFDGHSVSACVPQPSHRKNELRRNRLNGKDERMWLHLWNYSHVFFFFMPCSNEFSSMFERLFAAFALFAKLFVNNVCNSSGRIVSKFSHIAPSLDQIRKVVWFL